MKNLIFIISHSLRVYHSFFQKYFWYITEILQEILKLSWEALSLMHKGYYNQKLKIIYNGSCL
jgi:hypothetical protein